MKVLDMEPIIEKVKKSIIENLDIERLVIFTDSNPDNLSYCKGIKKVNDKEHYVDEVKIIDINSEEFDRFSIGPMACFFSSRVYIMDSVLNDEKVKSFIDEFGFLCYSEKATNCKLITPTPNAIIDTILYYYKNDLTNIVITIANRSNLIGKPTAFKLIDLNATINWVHTKTNDLLKNQYFNECDCIITAAGKPKSFSHCNNGDNEQLIIDVGINVVDGKVCGDWDIDKIEDKNIIITPNPGGIGKLTTYELFKEILK